VQAVGALGDLRENTSRGGEVLRVDPVVELAGGRRDRGRELAEYGLAVVGQPDRARLAACRALRSWDSP
jgi:hypothetical protein